MKLIELHILQSFPVSCLNRDDVGAPKSATFGGVQRARVSSQSQKRAVRMHAKDASDSGQFEGIRTRYLLNLFLSKLQDKSVENAEKVATDICNTLSKVDSKKGKEDQVTTAVYLSPQEIEEICTAIANGETVKKAVKAAKRCDAADIALFGRMVANDASLNVEGAAMFSHALSTHKVNNDIDFFSAVDDNKSESEDAGASMIGTLEFNSALYYRYTGLNLDLLTEPSHLGSLDKKARRKVVAQFIKSTLEAVPGARQNSMNAHTRPAYVLGVVKENGQPVQLINAFENPVWSPEKGFIDASIEKLKTHHDALKNTWGIESTHEVSLPDNNLNQFIEQLTEYVS